MELNTGKQTTSGPPGGAALDASVATPQEIGEQVATLQGEGEEGEFSGESTDFAGVQEDVLSVELMGRVDVIKSDKEVKDFVAMIDLKASTYKEEIRAPLDLVLVLDVSGSMHGERILNVKETAQFIAENLEEADRLAIVTYSSTSQTVLPLTRLTSSGKQSAIRTIKALSTGGSTALCDGLVLGLDLLRERGEDKNPIASVMLFTDGQANIGYRDAGSIIKATTDKAFARAGQEGRGPSFPPSAFSPPRRMSNNRNKSNKSNKSSRINGMFGSFFRRTPPIQVQQPPPPPPTTTTTTSPPAPPAVDSKKQPPTASVITPTSHKQPLPGTINTFGFGQGHNGGLLEAIAEHGRGLYYFMESTDLISDVFGDCLGGLVSVVAQEIQVTIKARSGVKIKQIMAGFPCTEIKKHEEYKVVIPDIQSEESRDILFKLDVPSYLAEATADAKEALIHSLVDVQVTYNSAIDKQHHAVKSTLDVRRPAGPLTAEQKAQQNLRVDEELNRFLAAEAMDRVLSLGESRREEALDLLQQTEKVMLSSPSANGKKTAGLVADMQQARAQLREVRSGGAGYRRVDNMIHNMKHGYAKQRSCAPQTQQYEMFSSSARSKMKKKFVKKY